jgi:hypothetical protein
LIEALDGVTEDLGQQWQEISLGARIWDGAKRLWRFLSDLIRRALSWIKEKFKLIIRAAHQASADGFSLLHRGFRLFADSVELLLSQEVRGSTVNIAMNHDRDFDFQVFVSPEASAVEIEAFFNHLRIRLIRFHATTRILKIFLSLAIVSARIIAVPWAWWSLVRTLIDFYGEFDDDDARRIREPLAV